MRRLKDDRGAVAVVVAVMALVLFGVAAVVVDVGALYEERRELQNGADAAARAVAAECLRGNCSKTQADSVAGQLAASNASDKRADASVCGNGDASWTAPCTPPPGVPTGARYVRVEASTSNPDGTKQVPPFFAKALDSGYPGTEVRASSVVVWGSPPRTGSSIPLIVSACEWKAFTGAGTAYAPLPSASSPYYDGPTGANPYPVSKESEITTLNGSTCRAGGGFNEDIPGGFGWLDTVKKTCEADIASAGGAVETVDSKQGYQPCIKNVIDGMVGTLVHLPMYASNPASNTYTVDGWASFFITGYSLNGAKDRKHIPSWDTAPACFASPSYDCVTGYFVNPPPTPGPVGGASFGETVVSLYE